MRFVFVIPMGGFLLKDALEKQGAHRVLESYWYIKNRAYEKTEAYYSGGINEVRKISNKRPRLLKGLS